MQVFVIRWNEDKCRCECKELIDKDICDKGFIWNPSNGKCECHKSCGIGEYLDYENCKFRKKLVDKLIEECIETDDKVKMAKITFAEYENECKSSCKLYIVLFPVLLTIIIGISTVSVYFYWQSMNLILRLILTVIY